MQVSLFRFDNYLTLSLGFLASVQSIWRHPVIGTLMYSVTRKLKALKSVFRQQRRCKGDQAMNVKLAAGYLEIAQNILQFDRHNSLLLLLEHCCRMVYLKASKLEQVMLRQRAKLQWLKGADQCSKVFFRRVATRRANKKIFQISDDDGNEQTEPTIISSLFVDYFQGLLGGELTDRAIDLRYLRSRARHILTDGEARAIICPITIDEVKTTFLDIEEDKAPGPDRFSSGFFKAAWPVVGEEVSKAIIDFFKTGRLLKQLNATLLTLIPKDGEFQYHWRCKDLNLFQLSFADDLLLFCKADVRSVFLFGRGLDTFATLSGLHTNPQKSQLIISKAASRLRDSLLATLGFQEGHLPVRYLGLPLISARLSVADCQPLLQKIDSRIKVWEGVQLSIAGRVQLIKSVSISFESSNRIGPLFGLIGSSSFDCGTARFRQLRITKEPGAGGKCSQFDIPWCLRFIFALEMETPFHFGMIRGTRLDLSFLVSPGDPSQPILDF
ncbi:hypothetical protein Sango_2929400 [Sesamum angolense]|uniref:Reverse transcriptase domain-containing protein n=1 Tax=Sesamum angolense TaxID=2727404 RepID=A0AAE1T4T9_9LAMI|nr:hypothetical protein Sango_2929400 [Sesamum angolense]